MASPTYEAKLQARQLETEEKLKKQMLKAKMRQLEIESTRTVNLLYKERVDKVKVGIIAKANVKLAKNIKAATVNRTLIAQIKSEMRPGIEMQNKERITREVRAEAKKRFASQLRAAIKVKYDTEKLYNSSVKEVEKRVPELRAQVTAQATAEAEKEAGMQIANAQSKLRAELLQKLRKDFLLKAKVKEAAEVKHATNGLSQMKAKAVEHDMHMALKQKANDYAEKQVEVQLADKSAEQKEKMLKEIIAMKAKARVHKMLKELIKDRAKKRVAVKLNQYYEDNLDKIASSDPLVAGNPSNVTDHEKPSEGPDLKKAESQVNSPVVELGSVLDSAAEISATEVATAEGRVDVNL